MIVLLKYKGYDIAVNHSGWFSAYDADEPPDDEVSAIASAETLIELKDSIDRIETSVSRIRKRPRFPVIDNHGIKGMVNGMHAGNGRPNARMDKGGMGSDAIYYGVPAVRALLDNRHDLLLQAREVEEQLNDTYRLPVIWRYDIVDDPSGKIKEAEKTMLARWEELNAEGGVR